ncbi:MAG: alkaline phosphatase family protein [Thermoplasmata archaeon]
MVAAAVSLVLLFLLSSAWAANPTPSSASRLSPTLEAAAGPAYPTPIRHVITIFMEDQGISDVLTGGSFERYLTTKYAEDSQFYGITSDSLANYRDAASGLDSAGSATTKNIPTLVDKAGESWASYEESMPTPCDESSTYFNTTLPASVVGTQTNHLVYDANHNPFVDFKNITSNLAYCKAHVLNLSAWNTSLQNGDLPNYVWIAPNDTDNDHHCPPATCPGAIPHGDAWLRAFLNPFLNSSAFSDSVVFLTFDYNSSEKTTTPANVYFVALSPYVTAGYDSTVHDNDYNLLTTTEWLLGLGHTGYHDNWTAYPPMMDLFGVTPTYTVTFTESGLPTKSTWSVTAGSPPQLKSTTGTSIVFSEPSGTLPVTITPPAGYGVSKTSASNQSELQVSGPVTDQVTFVKVQTVTFTEAGLPSGANWSVELTSKTTSGGPAPATHYSTGTQIVFTVARGGYDYAIKVIPAGYSTKDGTGSFYAGTSAVKKSVTFSHDDSEILMQNEHSAIYGGWEATARSVLHPSVSIGLRTF